MDPAASESQKPVERLVLLHACAGHALTHMAMEVFPAVLDPMRRSFELDLEEFTGYATLSTVLFGLGALPAGWLGDRIGERRMLVAFFALTALGCLILAAAADPLLLGAGMVVLGLGTSIFHPVGNALIARHIRNPGRAMGTNGMWGSLGTAGGPFLAAQCAYWVHWRAAYAILAVPALAFAVALARTRFEGDGEKANPPHGPGPSVHEAPPARTARRRAMLITALLLLAMTCGGLLYRLIVTMLPTHLGSRTGGASALLLGGTLASLLYAVGGAGQYAAGRIVHSREGRGTYCLVLLLLAPMIYLTGRTEGPALAGIGIGMAFALFAAQPIENTLLSRWSPPGARSFVFGLKFILAFGVGGLGTRLSGTIAERGGTSAVFDTAAVTALAALAFAVLAWRMRPPGASRSS